jgi:dipeptidyl-peptidase-4
MVLTKNKYCFYQSTENGSSINRAIYRIALNGKSKLALSDKIGTNDATFNYQYYINTFSSSAQATTYTLNEAKTGTQIKVIENNAALVAKLKDYNLPDKEFFVLKPKK